MSSLSTSEEYGFIRANAFARLWRNIMWTVASVALTAYVGALVFLIQYESDLTLSLRDQVGITIDTAALTRLQGSAAEFNRLVGLTADLQNSVVNWVPLLERLRQVAEVIEFTQLTVNETGQSSITGTAPTREAALQFRDTLERQCGITNVVLPLREILNTEGAVKFTVKFVIEDRSLFVKC